MLLAKDAVNQLKSGWNLVAVGESKTPGLYNSAAGGDLNTLWTWEPTQSKWYFYAPSLATQGGTALTNYISNHGFKDFTTTGKTLGLGIGFWVNRL